ncbi:MAG: ABC transporter ATP-binding protein [Candidatus Freyarchaeota archaeon]
MVLLEIKGLTKYFGGLAALKNVNIQIQQNEIVGLIGPNGAGKTTLFNCITGFYPPTSGTVIFKGEKITGLKPHKICRKGISRTFQIVKLFSSMTVLENVKAAVLFGGKRKTRKGDVTRKAMELLDFVGLSGKEDLMAKSLTLADQRLLEMARALATDPELLLLDEVVAGLNPKEVEETMKLIQTVREQGITVFMVEHVMKAVMGVSDRIIVLHHGKKLAEGEPKEIAEEKRVIEAYLGEKYLI